MTRRFAVSIVAVLLATVLAHARQSQPAAPQDPAAPKPGSIRGRVTAADTGRPLRRARVRLTPISATPSPASISTMTSAQGTFELKDVAPGSYYVSALRAGYLGLDYGQRRPSERGTAIAVESGATVERIEVALPRGAALGGRIVDETGEPYAGVRVMALQSRYVQGRRVPQVVGFAATDDLGQYRMAGLQPGAFIVAAQSSETWQNEKRETLGYAVTYFPGVASDLADPINLTVAQERLDLDFMLSMSRAARVRGRVQRESGETTSGDGVTLAVSVPSGNGVFAGTGLSARTAADGAFEIRNVAPGDYLISAAAANERASTPLAVKGDIDNLVLVTRGGSTVTGAIVTNEGAPPPFGASGVRLSLVAPTDERVLPTVRSPAVNSDWTFRLANVGGPFLFRIAGIPAGWMLHAVRLGEQELTDVAWDVPTGGRTIAGLQIVLTNEVGTISGDVIAATGKPTGDATVVLFSEDPAYWIYGSRFVHATRPDRAGHFSITGLPAGTFLAVARDFIENGAMDDPAFLESLRRGAERIVLDEGRSETITLKRP